MDLGDLVCRSQVAYLCLFAAWVACPVKWKISMKVRPTRGPSAEHAAELQPQFSSSSYLDEENTKLCGWQLDAFETMTNLSWTSGQIVLQAIASANYFGVVCKLDWRQQRRGYLLVIPNGSASFCNATQGQCPSWTVSIFGPACTFSIFFGEARILRSFGVCLVKSTSERKQTKWGNWAEKFLES